MAIEFLCKICLPSCDTFQGGSASLNGQTSQSCLIGTGMSAITTDIEVTIPDGQSDDDSQDYYNVPPNSSKVNLQQHNTANGHKIPDHSHKTDIVQVSVSDDDIYKVPTSSKTTHVDDSDSDDNDIYKVPTSTKTTHVSDSEDDDIYKVPTSSKTICDSDSVDNDIYKVPTSAKTVHVDDSDSDDYSVPPAARRVTTLTPAEQLQSQTKVSSQSHNDGVTASPLTDKGPEEIHLPRERSGSESDSSDYQVPPNNRPVTQTQQSEIITDDIYDLPSPKARKVSTDSDYKDQDRLDRQALGTHMSEAPGVEQDSDEDMYIDMERGQKHAVKSEPTYGNVEIIKKH